MSELKRIYRLSLVNGKSIREIEGITGIPSSTIHDYLVRLKKLNLHVQEVESMDDRELFSVIFPQKKLKKHKYELPDFKSIHRELQRKGVTLLLLHMEYSKKAENFYSYGHFCEMYNSWKKQNKISMRQKHSPAEKLYLDFAGLTVGITDRQTGKVKKCPLFVSCLGFSGYIYSELTTSQSQMCFSQAVANSFDFYKGVPEILVPDNLKGAVLDANYYNPKFNIVFSELADYYNTSIIPARVRKPKDKAKVETSVLLAERWILAVLRDKVFYSISEANIYIRQLLESLNDKVMKEYGKSRKDLFLEYEKNCLASLPDQPYKPRELKKVTVPSDYHISYNSGHYSVPYEYIKKKVVVEKTKSCINVFYKNKLISTHILHQEPFGISTKKEHMPPHHKKMVEFNELTSQGLISRAKQIGYNTQKLIEKIIAQDDNTIYRKRRCFGILNTAEKHEKDEAEKASKYMINQETNKLVENYRLILKNKAYKLFNSISDDDDDDKHKLCIHENIRGEESFI